MLMSNHDEASWVECVQLLAHSDVCDFFARGSHATFSGGEGPRYADDVVTDLLGPGAVAVHQAIRDRVLLERRACTQWCQIQAAALSRQNQSRCARREDSSPTKTPRTCSGRGKSRGAEESGIEVPCPQLPLSSAPLPPSPLFLCIKGKGRVNGIFFEEIFGLTVI